MAGFELSKWYADCVTDSGDVAIVYSAELRMAGVPLHYESLLLKDAGAPAEARYSLRANALPAMEDGRVEWRSREWTASGVWSELGAAQQETLYAAGAGSLEWQCVAPRAAARVVSGEKEYGGLGYAERLRLTVAPWKLPIRRLRWGRFVSATDAMVWIDWSGEYAMRVVYANGVRVGAERVSGDEVVLEGGAGALRLERGEVIREGELGQTALAVFPGLRRMFPASVLMMRECKWVSRAVLSRAGQAEVAGWAIHEVVEWP